MPTNPIAIEFSRHATSYHQLAFVQTAIAKRLIAPFNQPYKRILDLGAGGGALRRLWPYPFERFVGADIAEGMCQLHPKDETTIVCVADFDEEESWQQLRTWGPYDLILSSSALQWSRDPVALLQRIKGSAPAYGLALFVRGTFRTLYELISIPSPLPDAALLREVDALSMWEHESFSLTFAHGRELLSYIKQSGLNGWGKRLATKDIFALSQKLDAYPVLEFEVLYLWKF